MSLLPALREASTCPIVPVVTLDEAESAAPVAKALLEGGICLIEITLRTPAALESLTAIRHAVPEIMVGAGTITRAAQVEEALHAGASFLVSPGFCPEVAEAVRQNHAAWLPGAITPSEVMQARAAGFSLLKFFPAAESGGVERLRTYASLFPDVFFCPTGGIRAVDVPAYFAEPNVSLLGGSWLTPKDAVVRKDWAAISRLAAEAVALSKKNL